jgi:3-hydroxybutyryl-CoA dehydrogenase
VWNGKKKVNGSACGCWVALELGSMGETRFKTAAVIGTGMMGPGIALTLAMGGVRSTILSRAPESARLGVEKARAQARLLAEHELADAAVVDRAMGLIEGSADFDGTVRGADLVIESGPEDMAFKQELFARMDGLVGPGAVLASNTSGLSITAIAAGCRRPERVLTTHFWNPPHLMPLVEIVKGAKTSAETVEEIRGLMLLCGKTPVVVKKDRPGQLGNRLQMALVREAANIVAEGIAEAADVDTVARNGFGLRMPAYGILEHQDVVGLNLGLAVVDYVAQDLFNEPRAPRYFREMVGRGDLGAKTGKGFYDWSVKSADGVRARRDAFLIEVLRYRRLNPSQG